MKFLIIALTFGVLLVSCDDTNDQKDIDANLFYAEYMTIYNQADSIGIDGTIKAIQDYLVQYPEMTEAHLYEAYLLAHVGEMVAADKKYANILERDPWNIEAYEYWTSFMLLDSTRGIEAMQMIDESFELTDSSAILHNNMAWYHIIHTWNFEEATRQSELAMALDSDNLRYARTKTVALFGLNDNIVNMELFETLTNEDKVLLGTYFDGLIDEQELYGSL